MGNIRFKFLKTSKIRYVCVLIFFVLAFLVTLYYTKNGLGNDFSVFYFAADYARSYSNPWFSSVDPVYSAYVNGPLTAIIISPISLLSIESAVLVVRLLSVLSIPLNFWLLAKVLDFKMPFNSHKLWIASSLLLFSFPVRANLEYGQLFLLFSLFLSLSLFLLRTFSLIWVEVFSGILLGITLDYKPQVYGLVALIVMLKYRRVIIGIVISWLIGGIISVWLTNMSPFVSWAKAINLRSKGGFSSADQMNLVSLVNNHFVLAFLMVSLVGVGTTMIYRNRFSGNRNLTNIDWYLVSVAGFIFIPYLHPTDIYIVGVCLVIRLIHTNSAFSWIIFGFLITWSNSFEVFIAQSILVFLLGVLLRAKQKNLLLSMMPSLIFLVAIELSVGNESLTRKLVNCLLLPLIFLLEVANSKAVVK